LVILALHILIDTLAPAENAPYARAVLRAITGGHSYRRPAAHSRVATVLRIMSLAYSHFITPFARAELAAAERHLKRMRAGRSARANVREECGRKAIKAQE
jgi:hypothetical protein